MPINIHTCIAPVNIAVVKYWGKRDEVLILPANDSISVTLSKKNMCAKTTVACSVKFEKDRIWLNGKEEDILNPRLQNCIKEMRNRCKYSERAGWPLHICSENNFPTAAGLASSAAGFACLVKALAQLYEVDTDLTEIARQGSGSACRSIYGGFVRWFAGEADDGTDSIARQIATKEHWPELKAVILVVNDCQKETGSTKGMHQTMLTSELLRYRVSNSVPSRVNKITEAIQKKNFHDFADITMKESNQFHAVCLDTYPPIHYLNSTSYKIISLVHAYNAFYGENRVAYTFDAGSNACLYTLENDVSTLIGTIRAAFPPVDKDKVFVKGYSALDEPVPKDLLQSLNLIPLPDAIQYIINTQVGSGPAILEGSNNHLLNQNGLPR